MGKKKVIVIGSYIVALVMDTERFPVTGETLMGKNFRQTYGGKGSNQAVQAARLGADVSFVGKIGNDSFGQDFLSLCEKERVNHDFVFVNENMPTATGFIICAEGHNIITIDIGALKSFSPGDIDLASHLFTPGDVALIQLEIPLETALYSAKTAKNKGSVAVLNPAPASALQGMDLSFIDFLTPNETEAQICAGLAPDDPCNEYEVGRKLLGLGCSNVIITLGEKGSLLLNRNEEILVPPFHIQKVVDSTGAGDAFNAAFAVAIAEGSSITDAMRFGNTAGALSCTKADTIPSFHARHEIEMFLRSVH